MTAIDMSELSFEVASSEICQFSQRSSNGVSTGNSERLSLAMQNLEATNQRSPIAAHTSMLTLGQE